jgi:hypothetical protein
MRVVTALCFAFGLLASGTACSSGSSAGEGAAQRSPSEVLKQFLAAMDQSASDDRALRVAYDLLASPAQKALEARAARVKTLAGQELPPWQMLAQGRFRLRFSPASRRGMKETINGDRATVTVAGTAAGERADVPLVREQGQWRLQLVLD